jgi:hypothetical protein
MALVLLIISAAIVTPLGAWHFSGYFNGRYERWAGESK